MEQISKKAKTVLISLGLLTIAVVGLTVAYYSSQKDFENQFRLKEPGVAIYEKFNPTDWWVPGEEKSKEAWFTNTGELDMLLRFKIDVDWAEKPKDKDGKPIEDVDPRTVVNLYWKGTKKDGQGKVTDPVLLPTKETEGFDFIPIVQTEDGKEVIYYYYTKILKAKDMEGSSTKHVLESEGFSKELSNDGHKNSDYSNTQIDLTIKGETVLVDENAVKEQWPGVAVEFKKGADGNIISVAWEKSTEESSN